MASVRRQRGSLLQNKRSLQRCFGLCPPKLGPRPHFVPSGQCANVVIHTAAHIHNQQNDRAVISQYASRSEEALVAWLESSPAEPTESDYRAQRRFAEVQRGELMVHQQDVRRALDIRRVIPHE